MRLIQTSAKLLCQFLLATNFRSNDAKCIEIPENSNANQNSFSEDLSKLASVNSGLESFDRYTKLAYENIQLTHKLNKIELLNMQDQLNSKLEKLSKIDNFEKILEEFRKKDAEKIASLEARLANLENKVENEKYEEKIENLERKLTQQGKMMVEQRKEFMKVLKKEREQHLAAMEVANGKVETALGKVVEIESKFEGSVKKFSENVENIDGKVDGIDEEMNTKLEELTVRVSDSEAKLGQQTTSIATLESRPKYNICQGESNDFKPYGSEGAILFRGFCLIVRVL